MADIKRKNDVRHPTDRKGSNSTDSHPLISIGSLEKKILRYANSLNGERFNVSNYSRRIKRSRTTVLSALYRLVDKGLIMLGVVSRDEN